MTLPRLIIARAASLTRTGTVACTVALACAVLAACTQDAYDKGEGKYSLTRADFVEAHANGAKQVDYVLTDDGEQLSVQQPFTMKWITTADSVYRCVLYYNKVEQRDGLWSIDAVSVGQVPCPRVTPKDSLKSPMKTDPVKFESAWLSRSRKYVNLTLYLMTGATDDEQAAQQLGLVQDTVIGHADRSRTCQLTLYHDQGGVPEYYSTRCHVSIATDSIKADSVCISINTYQGVVSRVFPCK